MDRRSAPQLKRPGETIAKTGPKRQYDQFPPIVNPEIFRLVSPFGENPYAHFKTLSETDRKVYFDQIFKTLRSFPRIDLMVFQNYDKGDRLRQEEREACDKLQERWGDKWSPVQPNPRGPGRRRQREIVKWEDDQLWWNPSTQDFELSHPPNLGQRHSLEHFETLSRDYGFLCHISSSLLFYRLILLMGDSNFVSTDGYKSCWEVRFYHIDCFTFLRLWDSKGAPRVSFYGSEESQNDALEVINLLTRYKFPHTYDGVIAGTPA